MWGQGGGVRLDPNTVAEPPLVLQCDQLLHVVARGQWLIEEPGPGTWPQTTDSRSGASRGSNLVVVLLTNSSLQPNNLRCICWFYTNLLWFLHILFQNHDN